MELNAKQKDAIARVLEGHNVWILGPPGTGKSITIEGVKHAVLAAGKTVAVAAMTGAAASILQNATTLHRYTGVGTESLKMHLSIFVKSSETISEKTKEKLRSTDILIIDEAGMLATDQFQHLDEFLRTIRKNRSKLCGGMQIVLVGDIAQLPPVDATAGVGTQREEKIPMTSIFSYPDNTRWNCVVLNQFMRSAEDLCLQQICLALIDPTPQIRKLAIDLLNKKCYTADSISNSADVIEQARLRGALIITPTNGKVDHYVCVERSMTSATRISLQRPTRLYSLSSLTAAQIAAAGGYSGVEREDKEIWDRGTFKDEVDLFPGQQVQLRMNGTDGTTPYYNGEICNFLEMKEKNAVVRRCKDDAIIHVGLCEHRTEYEADVGKIGYLAYPIVPAIGTTIHKVQGQTLEGCIMDPSGLRSFGKAISNMIFVAVSRVRTCSKLLLTEPIAADLLTGKELQDELESLWSIDFMAQYPRANKALLEEFLAEPL
jgi:hypothetical protein